MKNELEREKEELTTQIDTKEKEFDGIHEGGLQNIKRKQSLNRELKELKHQLETINRKLTRSGGLIRKKSWRRKKNYKKKRGKHSS